MSGGYRAALSVQFGSLVGDAAWAALGLAGIGLLLQADSLKIPVGIAGAGYLAWLAWDSWRASRGEAEIMVPNQEGSAMRSGVVLSLSNPQNVAYWAGQRSLAGLPMPALSWRHAKATLQRLPLSAIRALSLSCLFLCCSLGNVLICKRWLVPVSSWHQASMPSGVNASRQERDQRIKAHKYRGILCRDRPEAVFPRQPCQQPFRWCPPVHKVRHGAVHSRAAILLLS